LPLGSRLIGPIKNMLRIFTDSDQQSQLNPIGFLTGNRSEFSELSDQRFHGKPIRDWEFVRRVIGMK
jgi:hypothetical protein